MEHLEEGTEGPTRRMGPLRGPCRRCCRMAKSRTGPPAKAQERCVTRRGAPWPHTAPPRPLSTPEGAPPWGSRGRGGSVARGAADSWPRPLSARQDLACPRAPRRAAQPGSTAPPPRRLCDARSLGPRCPSPRRVKEKRSKFLFTHLSTQKYQHLKMNLLPCNAFSYWNSS